MSTTFHALRYERTVPLKSRTQRPIDRRFASWSDAEDARLSLPQRNLLEVVEREVPAPPVMQS